MPNAGSISIPTAADVHLFPDEPSNIRQARVHDDWLCQSVRLDDRDHEIVKDRVASLIRIDLAELRPTYEHGQARKDIAARLEAVKETGCQMKRPQRCEAHVHALKFSGNSRDLIQITTHYTEAK